MNPLIAVVGPTATGKSRLAVRLAQEFDGEIIGADSRQVYRHLDIGTAKPDGQELAGVPHHLIDIINPNEDFGLAQYQHLAYRALEDISQRDKLALLAGGSGLYLWAVLEGWVIPKVAPDPELRYELEQRAENGEGLELYRELMEIDPAAARKIDPHNLRRLIRALEISKYSDVLFSQQQRKNGSPFDALIIGLTAERPELYRRIDSRVDSMIEQGLVEEVRKLADLGFSRDLPALSGIGYKQIGAFLEGGLTLAEAIQQIKTETHRLVRRQYNWFRLTDDRINWFDITYDFEPEVFALARRFISK
ncbi:MAG: tRNA (adenosine(37)-N6)-dimethylallyltransferase MiaA [Dehalococcoidales bacterium]|nr:tRNA (adenosine(37)-N6)-dimethylallyltransferase MiaA [Dehalococcoidales bacterium]